jgi:hypothetical protein
MTEQEAESTRSMDGVAAAATLAAAIGIFILGLVTSLAEARSDFKDWLTWNDSVGSLSGKSSLGLIGWAVTWPVLHVLLRRRDHILLAAIVVSLVLFLVGSVLMFPPVFQRLER